jgi:hypothetical protein
LEKDAMQRMGLDGQQDLMEGHHGLSVPFLKRWKERKD